MTTYDLRRGIFMMLLLSCFSFQIKAQIFVDASAIAGGDGNSWATAYNDLQTALLSASYGDQIWVADGTYGISGDEEDSFEIPNGVALYGGFAGIPSETQLIHRDWDLNEAHLEGGDSINTIVYFENVDNTTILDGFYIQNGNADGVNQRNRSGSAIYMDIIGGGSQCNPVIRNCVIRNNDSDNGGGAVYIDGSFVVGVAPHFENVSFINNYSFSAGGALYQNGIQNGAATATFIDCTFKDNYAVDSGGAIFNHGGNDGNVSSVFKKCNFENNTAEGNGGAMYSLGTKGGEANHLIVNCRFYNNKGFAAGGIYNNGGGVSSSTNNPGDASPDIINCTFYGNEATGNGGTGGAIYNNGSSGGQSNTIISNCVIWGNIAPYGTHVIKNVHCSPTISYCLVDAEDCDELDNGSGSNITCGSGILYETNDPAFEDEAGGDLRLTNLSDAKNSGDDTATNEPDDLDGKSRNVDGIDMGAYEFSETNLPVELISFEAIKNTNTVKLIWITATEIDHDYFEVEKSSDGRNFSALKKVNGAGNTSYAQSYSTLDTSPANGDNYYRLKIVSFFGEVEYSEIRTVRFDTQALTFYPNPVHDRIFVELGDQHKSTNVSYEVFSIYGLLIQQGTLDNNGPVAEILINDTNLASGQYILNINLDHNEVVHHRFQKLND